MGTKLGRKEEEEDQLMKRFQVFTDGNTRLTGLGLRLVKPPIKK